MSQEKYTWRQLKEFANSLPEEFLDNKVVCWSESDVHIVGFAEPLEEDYVVHPIETDGCIPLSEAKGLDSPIEEFSIAYKKGTPIIHLKF